MKGNSVPLLIMLHKKRRRVPKSRVKGGDVGVFVVVFAITPE